MIRFIFHLQINALLPGLETQRDRNQRLPEPVGCPRWHLWGANPCSSPKGTGRGEDAAGEDASCCYHILCRPIWRCMKSRAGFHQLPVVPIRVLWPRADFSGHHHPEAPAQQPTVVPRSCLSPPSSFWGWSCSGMPGAGTTIPSWKVLPLWVCWQSRTWEHPLKWI